MTTLCTYDCFLMCSSLVRRAHHNPTQLSFHWPSYCRPSGHLSERMYVHVGIWGQWGPKCNAPPKQKPAKSGKTRFGRLRGLGGLGVCFIVTGAILLHLGLVTFRIHFRKARKPNHFYGSWTWWTWPWLPKSIILDLGGTSILLKVQEI